MLVLWRLLSTTKAFSDFMQTTLILALCLSVSAAVDQVPASLDSGFLVVAGKNLPLEKVSNLVAPHFAVVVRGKEGTKINRTVPLPSCLFKASGHDVQVDQTKNFA